MNIKLTDNLQLTRSYDIRTDTAIDLNGYKITADLAGPLFTVEEHMLLIVNSGDANGGITNRGIIGIAQNRGHILIDSGEYVSLKQQPFRAEVDGSVTVNGGTLTGQEGAVISREGHGRIVINGGNLTGLDNFAVATNGTSGWGGNYIEINDGHLEGNITSPGYEAIGVYIANDDTFIMNGGEIVANGGTGLCMRAGTVIINGGSITATNVAKDGHIVADGKIGDDNTVMEGCSGVIYHESANYPGKEGMNLIITGGTITGVDHSIQVLSNEVEPQVRVEGGEQIPPYLPPDQNGTEGE